MTDIILMEVPEYDKIINVVILGDIVPVTRSK